MNRNILYCASTTSHIKNFHLPYIEWLSNNGYKVTALTDDGQPVPYTIKSEKAAFTKKMTSPSNLTAIFETRRHLIKNNYALVVTNTTLAGAVVRAAILLLPKCKRPKVLHICHGFLFNETDGLKKRVLLFPEKILRGVTDVYAVMNRESENIAEQNRLGKKIVFTHGMGVDAEKFHRTPSTDNTNTANAFNFVYVADFSARKNQAELIRAFASVIDRLPTARLVFAGNGVTLRECKRLAKDLRISNRVKFLGYVNNVNKLLAKCDAAVSSSRYEGLPFNIMEAMLSGLPVIASNIAGHYDLLGFNSLYIGEEGLADKLAAQYAAGKRRVMYEDISRYTLGNVFEEWADIFISLLGNENLSYNQISTEWVNYSEPLVYSAV